ncbi:tyrosine-type recombinase/integrase [Magnetofaba australis]|uniref:Putative tyrosine recombinase n=1 Tax=Magnetofaba australis IT-1 TaxID=1434232 RepID=A0A1Y2K7K8_9PROT|nr:tyrosine-type recombinase/integrase [Magnetofaba australis]OSM06743.1 putative tyrosine recombinase [Magnetofaba australis IT-1]
MVLHFSGAIDTVDQSSNPDLPVVVRICLATGARWGEAEGLLTSQLHRDRIEFQRTKGGRNRVVPVDLDLMAMIETRIQEHGHFRPSMNAFRTALDKSGLELPKGQLTHVLRHTFASHFIMAGGNILVLQRILGHTTLTMTMRYAHLAPDHLLEAVKLNPLKSALTLC